MNVVVDSNVVAYLLLGTMPQAHEILRVLGRCEKIFAPDLWRSELTNVMWMAVRTKGISLDHALTCLDHGDALISDTIQVSSLWGYSLRLSVEYDHPPYDTVYVALAKREQATLLTYDKRLLKKFPGVAVRPGEL
jgi:predicted nucleic acid-binding protein